MSLAVGKNLLGTQRVINQWGEQQKGWTKFLKFSRGKQRGGWETSIFDLNFVRGKTLEETMKSPHFQGVTLLGALVKLNSPIYQSVGQF